MTLSICNLIYMCQLLWNEFYTKAITIITAPTKHPNHREGRRGLVTTTLFHKRLGSETLGSG